MRQRIPGYRFHSAVYPAGDVRTNVPDHAGTIQITVGVPSGSVPDDLVVTVDGNPATRNTGGTPDVASYTVLASQGDHAVSIHGSGIQPVDQTVSVMEGRTAPLAVQLTPQTLPPPAVAPPSLADCQRRVDAFIADQANIRSGAVAYGGGILTPYIANWQAFFGANPDCSGVIQPTPPPTDIPPVPPGPVPGTTPVVALVPPPAAAPSGFSFGELFAAAVVAAVIGYAVSKNKTALANPRRSAIQPGSIWILRSAPYHAGADTRAYVTQVENGRVVFVSAGGSGVRTIMHEASFRRDYKKL